MKKPKTINCRDCDRPVFWARTSKDRPILIDAEEDEAGGFQIVGTVETDRGPVPKVWVLRVEHRGGPGLHNTHFETCPMRRRT